ncbi:hypothetical protein CHS0354_005155, partial [Potamilus streckersoni]
FTPIPAPFRTIPKSPRMKPPTVSYVETLTHIVWNVSARPHRHQKKLHRKN